MKRKGLFRILIAACAACLISATSYSATSTKPTDSYVSQYTASIGLDVRPVPGGMTSGRARSLVGAVMGLISLVVGGLALGRAGTGSGRGSAMLALALGLIGIILSVVHLATFTGGFGTGSGRAGAIVALVLSLIGIILGWLALARSRRVTV